MVNRSLEIEYTYCKEKFVTYAISSPLSLSAFPRSQVLRWTLVNRAGAELSPSWVKGSESVLKSCLSRERAWGRELEHMVMREIVSIPFLSKNIEM